MTREELTAIVKRSTSTTLMACRMREALGLPPMRAAVKFKAKRNNGKRYKGARKLMRQRYGVRL